jgi:hypothetical protein
MSSTFSKYLKKRDVTKVVDNHPQDVISTEVTSPNNQTDSTPPSVISVDISQISRETLDSFSTVKDQLLSTASPKEAFYSSVLDAKYPLATGEVKQAPPTAAYAIVERDVFRTTGNPKLLLLRDLAKQAAATSVSQFVYDQSYTKIFDPAVLNSILEMNPFLQGLFFKDQQSVNKFQELLNTVSSFSTPKPDFSFYEGLAEVVVQYDPTVRAKFMKGVEWVLHTKLDKLYDEYATNHSSSDAVLGDAPTKTVERLSTSGYVTAGEIFRDLILEATEALEYSAGIEADPDLFQLRNYLDEGLYSCLGHLETDFASEDSSFVTVQQATSLNLDCVRESEKVKDYLSAVKAIRSSSDTAQDLVQTFESFVQSAKGAVETRTYITPIVSSVKIDTAISLLKEWLKL